MSKPILILGAGVQPCRELARKVIDDLGVPVCLTWGAADVLPWDHPLRVGTFGTHGNKYANLAIQNADFVLSIGSRLDTKATGFPVSSFAPNAKLVMVDIDPTEIDKFKDLGREVEGAVMDAGDYLFAHTNPPKPSASWLSDIARWKAVYPAVVDEWRREDSINPYVFVDELSNHVKADDVIVSDTGCALGWMMQAYKFKGERFIHAFNNTPMGYGLPGAVGAHLATGRRVVLVTGDGGLGVNITELATIARHAYPIKIVLFNNRGHAMCRQTQRQWMGGEYPSTSYAGGLACPNFTAIAEAYGFDAKVTVWPDAARRILETMMQSDKPSLLELAIDQSHGIVGQIKFGEPLAEAA
jgi:acetolactate synthase-1/2/3 large subunit